jgi:hypothetical protein
LGPAGTWGDGSSESDVIGFSAALWRLHGFRISDPKMNSRGTKHTLYSLGGQHL